MAVTQANDGDTVKLVFHLRDQITGPTLFNTHLYARLNRSDLLWRHIGSYMNYIVYKCKYLFHINLKSLFCERPIIALLAGAQDQCIFTPSVLNIPYYVYSAEHRSLLQRNCRAMNNGKKQNSFTPLLGMSKCFRFKNFSVTLFFLTHETNCYDYNDDNHHHHVFCTKIPSIITIGG